MRTVSALIALAVSPCIAQNLAIDFAEIGAGSRIYAKNCANQYCHGAAGKAGQAAALLGRGWDRERIDRAVLDGVENTNMPSWEGKLPPVDEILPTWIHSLSDVSNTSTRLVLSP